MSTPSTDASGSESRSATVCFLCRQRKTKCDRNLPRCGFCIKAKVDCQYTSRPKKRGLRAGYVSELESRLEVLENEVRESKRQRPAASSPVLVQTPQTPFSSTSNTLTSPAALLSPSSTFDRTLQRTDAVEDLKSLPLPLIYNLVELWFKDNHPWCPIIHRRAMQASLEALPTPVDRVDDVVLRAVLALMISFSSQAIILGYKGRRRLSQYLRSEVLAEALGKVSLSSLQALLIISILDYGSDDVQSTWSLLSVCRRMCEQTGLFRQVQAQIEHQSPVNVGPPSREAFESDELAVPLTWVTLALDSASTLGAAWRDASASLMDHLASVAYLSTPDFSDSFRTTTHLAAIGLQPVQMLFYEQSESTTLAACDEIYENLLTYRRSQSLPTYTILPDGSIDFDPNAVLTSMLTNAAIIVLYQRPISLTDPAHADAKQRCIDACEEMITTIRTVSDADTELNSPLLSPRIFAAARFMLALFKATGQPRQPSFDVLMHGINMCGRRWTLARRLDICLRAAIAELDAIAEGEPITSITLPADFWDLRKSAVDINEDMKVFVGRYKPNLFVGSLNGPYA